MNTKTVSIYMCLLIAALATSACCKRGPAGESIRGERGEAGQDGASIVGPQGPQGLAGADGEDGESITGPKGDPGQNGTDGVSPVLEVIDPCGDTVNAYDEILISIDAGIFAYFESGGNRRLSLVPPGTYATTDGTSCIFHVDNQGVVTW